MGGDAQWLEGIVTTSEAAGPTYVLAARPGDATPLDVHMSVSSSGYARAPTLLRVAVAKRGAASTSSARFHARVALPSSGDFS
jgi:hypothetical protein